jgi:hypothetical protein
MALLDVARGDDRHTAERLTAEPVIWLGTVRSDGRPHNVPVWFAWHDPLVLIFSMPEGRATLVTGAGQHPHFLAAKFREKYAQSLGDTPFEQWRATFSQPLLIHVQRITAWTRTATGVAYRVVP